MKDLKKIVENRRSVHFFDKNKNIEDNLLKEIISLAALTPSAFNLQPWEVIVIKSEDSKKRLYSLAYNQEKIINSSLSLLILSNKNAYDKSNITWSHFDTSRDINLLQEKAFFLYGSTEDKKLKFAESHAGFFAMSIMYIAKYFGLEAHPVSGIDFDGIKKEFNIDSSRELSLVLCLGYLDKNTALYPRLYRKKYEDFVKEI